MPKPNWKEAFEWALARGGVSCLTVTGCNFCVLAGHADKGSRTGKDCSDCPLNVVNSKGTDTCARIKLDDSERRAICRHVLATVKDFTDRDEIRARIAEMLDDDAREKFVGKAKAEYHRFDLAATGFMRVGGNTKVVIQPNRLAYTIIEGKYPKDVNDEENFIAAFRDAELRDLVLKLLREAK